MEESVDISLSFGQSTLVGALIMLVIIGLLMLWETCVHALRHRTPPSLLPALESSMAEIGGLGFIGLLLELVWVKKFAENHEELLEAFEFLHTIFFRVAIGYFLFSAWMVHQVVVQIDDVRSMKKVEDEQIERNHRVGLFPSPQLMFEPTSAWKELIHGYHDRSAEFLIIRHRFQEKYHVPQGFRLDMNCVFSSYLSKLVHCSPLIWLPLIPAIALGEAVDLTRGIVSANSPSALISAGHFYANNATWYMALLWQTATLLLCIFNFFYMVQFKNQSIHDDNAITELELDGGSMINDKSDTNTETTSLRSVGSCKAYPCQVVPSWFLTSIQYQNWFSVSFLVLVFTEVLVRDIRSLISIQGLDTGTVDPDQVRNIQMEALSFAGFSVLNILQLTLIFPKVLCGFLFSNFDKDNVTKTAIHEQIYQVESTTKHERS